MECHWALAVFLIVTFIGDITGNAISRPVSRTSDSKFKSSSCQTYTQSGEGNFKLQRKHYTSKRHDYYIKEVQLLKRTSFYKCEPKNEKYGLEEATNTWWVDKGCEGLFRVTVCPDNGEKQHPHPENWRGTVYSELLLSLQVPVKQIDWTHFNMKEVENRFEYHALEPNKKQ